MRRTHHKIEKRKILAKNLNELLKKRSVNRKNVNAHEKRMREEVRS